MTDPTRDTGLCGDDVRADFERAEGFDGDVADWQGIARELADVHRTHAPRPDWQTRVLAQIDGELDEEPARGGAKVLAFRRRGWLISVPIVAAAAIAIFVLRGRETPDDAGLPVYTLEFEGSAGDLRGPESPTQAPVRLWRDASVRIVLRPAIRADATVAVRGRLFSHDTDGDGAPWQPAFEVFDGGTVEVVGPAAQIFPVGPGAYTLVIGVGPISALPVDAAGWREPTGSGWRRVERRIVIEGD